MFIHGYLSNTYAKVHVEIWMEYRVICYVLYDITDIFLQSLEVRCMWWSVFFFVLIPLLYTIIYLHSDIFLLKCPKSYLEPSREENVS